MNASESSTGLSRFASKFGFSRSRSKSDVFVTTQSYESISKQPVQQDTQVRKVSASKSQFLPKQREKNKAQATESQPAQPAQPAEPVKINRQNSVSSRASLRKVKSKTDSGYKIVPDTKHWDEQSQKFMPFPSDLASQPIEDAKVMALAIYYNTEPSHPSTRSASWLGEQREFPRKVLYALYQLFNWSQVTILDALRDLCKHIRLQGETQQINRVLDGLALRWCECNQNHGFLSLEVVHRILYSLVLLNTDLHSPRESGHTRLTQSKYTQTVSNALKEDVEKIKFDGKTEIGSVQLMSDNTPLSSTAWSRAVILELQLFYQSVASRHLESPPDADAENPEMTRSKSGFAGFRNRYNSISSLVTLANSPASTRGPHSTPIGSTSLGRSLSGSRRVPSENRSESSLGGASLAEDVELNQEIQKLRLQGPPWAKEGAIQYRFFNKASKASKPGRWAEAFALAEQGQLKLYQLPSSSRRSSSDCLSDSAANYGKGDWLKTARMLQTIRLLHALAQHTGSTSQWSLILDNAQVIQFKSGSKDSAQEFVYTCNYWAARISKPPLLEMVASTEFGWDRPVGLHNSGKSRSSISSSSEDVIFMNGEKVTIHLWSPQKNPDGFADPNVTNQLKRLEQYVKNVDEEISVHSAALGAILALYTPKLAATQRVTNNWESRSQWLLQQSVQYSQYCQVLKRSLNIADKSVDNSVVSEKQVEEKDGFIELKPSEPLNAHHFMPFPVSPVNSEHDSAAGAKEDIKHFNPFPL